jgi:hypothetical protein
MNVMVDFQVKMLHFPASSRILGYITLSYTNRKPLLQALLAGEGVPASAEDQELAINKVRYHSFSTYVIDRWHPSFSFCFGSCRQYLPLV